MIIKEMTINNFLGIGNANIKFNYSELVLIEGENRDSSVSTSNGAGKSSIPEALLWCLYGVTKRGLKADEVVNRVVGKDCFVQVVFDDYTVTRFRSHSKEGNTLRVFHKDKELTCGTVSATQDLIDNATGLNKAVFEKLFHFGQGDTQPLAAMTDAALKGVLEQALRISCIVDYSTKIKGVLKEEKGVLEKINAGIKEVDGRIAAFKELSEKYEKQIEEATSRAAFENAKLRKETELLGVKIKRCIEEAKINKKILQDIAADLFDVIEDGQGVRDLEEIQRVVDSLIRRQAESEATVKEHLRLAEKHKEKLIALKAEQDKVKDKVGEKCPSCRKPITEDDISDIFTSLAQKFEKELSRCPELRENLEKAKESFEEAGRKLLETQELRRVAKSYDATIAEEREARMQKEMLEKTIKANQAEAEEVARQVKEMASRVAACKKDKATKEEAASEAQDSVNELEILLEIFGNGGLKSYILDSVTPRLNELVNEYMAKLDDMRVEISTRKTLKSGEQRDQFEITIHTPAGVSSFGALSGGERQRVCLALSLAFNKLTREMIKTPLNVLFLDEVVEALDETSAEAMYDLIREFALDVQNVFVISHNHALRDIIPEVITIVKEGGVASIG